MIKKIILFQIILLVLWSCKQNEEYKTEKKIIISGRVLNHNLQREEIELRIFRVCQEREIITTKLDSSGNFTFSFKSHYPIETDIVFNTELTVLAHPGDSIFVEFDGRQNYSEILKSVKYSGSDAKLNSDIATFKKILFTNYVSLNKTDQSTATMQFDVADFELYLDTMQQGFDNFVEAFIKEASPCNEAIEWGKFYLKQNIYIAVVNYAFNHQFEDKSKPPYFNIHVSFYDRFLDVTPINYSTFLNSKELHGFIDKYWHFYAFFNLVADKSYKQKQTEQGFLSSVEMNDSIEFAGINKYTPDKLLRQLVYTEKIRREFDALKIEPYEENQEMISQIITEPYLKQLIKEKYTYTKEKLDNPKIASDAILKSLVDSPANKIMDSILIENKGKVIYIDCWADYCGPCLTEMPNSKALMELMKGKDVSFVYVCLNSKEKQWKALLDRFQLGGKHYFLNKTQSEEWENVFNITGVPYYFLIDKNGTIVENGSYLRPNVTEGKINKLLKE